MKICAYCGQEKELIEFVRQKRNLDGRSNICKKCESKRVTEYYKKNPEKSYRFKYRQKDLERKVIDSRKRREIVKSFIHDYKKEKQCSICGYNENTDILVFHHRDPTKKEYKISKRNASNPEILKKEIEKCNLLCPNCHRELHWKETQDNLKENVSESTIKKRKYQEWFNELKRDGCKKCGEKRFYALDYHHNGKDKEYEIHKMVRSKASKKKLLKEISKCTLLCANCHSKLHLN
jgi:hypothetical protein